LKAVVILLVVLNLLAAFFLMTADSGITGVSSSKVMPASGLALLSEVEVELKVPLIVNVAPITVDKSTLVVDESFLEESVIVQ
jgi:hypothetical protein